MAARCSRWFSPRWTPRPQPPNRGRTQMSKTMKIAVVDDEKDMRQSISQWLALSGFDTETFGSAEEALKSINPDFPGIVVSDVRMPGMDGMQLLRKIKSIDSTLPVIMITRSEEHTSELQSRQYLVCRLLLEKKKKSK